MTKDRLRSRDRKETENEQVGKDKTIVQILLLENPMGDNLCFSNAVANLLLNIPIFVSFLSEKSGEMEQLLENNSIIRELKNLSCLPNFSNSSTRNLRSAVHQDCIKNRQSRTFDDKKQHDAGEFLLSIFEHIFKNLPPSNNIDEKMFGGLLQESLECRCGYVKELPIQKLPEINMIPIEGNSIQACIDDFFENEETDVMCSECQNPHLIKKTKIINEPTTLLIQLKRYSYEREETIQRKRQDNIPISKEIRLAQGSSFTVSSILNHFGDSPEEGHYNILIYDEAKDSFVLADDLHVNQNVKISSDFQCASYIFVYTKNDSYNY